MKLAHKINDGVVSPSDRITRKSFFKKAVVQTLLASFAILAALIQLELLTRLVVVLGNPADYSCPSADKKFAIASQKPDGTEPKIAFLGASYSEMAIAADLIERKLALKGERTRILNLAVRSSWPKDQCFFLKELVKQSGKPAMIFYDVVPLGFNVNPDYAERYSPQFENCFRNFEITDLAERPLFLDAYLKRHLYFYRYRSYLKQLLMEMWPKLLEPDNARLELLRSREIADVTREGWVCSGHFPYNDEVVSSEKARLQNITSWTMPAPPDKTHLRYLGLNELRKYCKDQQIPLVLLWLPQQRNSDRLWTTAMNLGTQDFREAFEKMADGRHTWFVNLHELCLESDNVNATPFAPSPYFADYDHLNVLGAIKVADALVNIIDRDPFKQFLTNSKTRQHVDE